MYTAKKKIHKDKDVEPTEFEETVAQVIFLPVFLVKFRSLMVLISHSGCLAVSVWFGEYQPGTEKWSEGSLHKFCSVRHIQSPWFIYIYFLVLVIFTNWGKPMFFSQMDVSGNRKAVVIYVPYRLRKAFRKIHLRLVRELEKKFSGKVMLCKQLMVYQLYKWLRNSVGRLCYIIGRVIIIKTTYFSEMLIFYE